MTRRPIVVLLLALAAGCSSAVPTGNVSGEVKLDGQPLKEGLIRFVPADGKSAYSEFPISDGKYTAVVPQGDARVEITADRVVRREKMYDTPDSPLVDVKEEMIPEKYNTASELKYTVTAGPQTKNFELEGAKPTKGKKEKGK